MDHNLYEVDRSLYKVDTNISCPLRKNYGPLRIKNGPLRIKNGPLRIKNGPPHIKNGPILKNHKKNFMNNIHASRHNVGLNKYFFFIKFYPKVIVTGIKGLIINYICNFFI